MTDPMEDVLNKILAYEKDIREQRGIGKVTRAVWDARFHWLFRADARATAGLTDEDLANINNDWLVVSANGWSEVAVINPDGSTYLTVPALFVNELLTDMMAAPAGEPRKILGALVQGGNVPEPFIGEKAISTLEQVVGSSGLYSSSAVDAMARRRIDVIRQVASMAAAAGVPSAAAVQAIMNSKTGGANAASPNDRDGSPDAIGDGWTCDD